MRDMGTEPLIRQTPGPAPAPGVPIVAFDFDGTLTIRDSFTAFLRWRAGPARWAVGLARLTPAVLTYAHDRDRGRIKAASVREFLGGLDRATLEAEAERFAEFIWPRFIRPDALACWQDWGRKGAHRVIVTASPEITVAPFARRLGAEALLGTQVRRLRAAYGDDLQLAAAYGDTSGDTEMLAFAAEAGFRVFTARPGLRRP